MALRAPLPYFGGKSRIADVVWRYLGDPIHYVEPFFGSGAVLLAREMNNITARAETVNDVDSHLVNFWRAVKKDPEGLKHYYNYPTLEVELQARVKWIYTVRPSLSERLKEDVEYFDSEIAGWWVWAKSSAIANNADRDHTTSMPKITHFGGGVTSFTYDDEVINRLCKRLERVRVLCGDWSRLINIMTNGRFETTGIFFDPPYVTSGILKNLYVSERTSLIEEMQDFCLEHGNNPRIRIALAGYGGDYNLPGWTVHRWQSHGGYGVQYSKDGSHAKSNRDRETIWFSPHCVSYEEAAF